MGVYARAPIARQAGAEARIYVVGAVVTESGTEVRCELGTDGTWRPSFAVVDGEIRDIPPCFRFSAPALSALDDAARMAGVLPEA